MENTVMTDVLENGTAVLISVAAASVMARVNREVRVVLSQERE